VMRMMTKFSWIISPISPTGRKRQEMASEIRKQQPLDPNIDFIRYMLFSLR
jgi:hypothetical protein